MPGIRTFCAALIVENRMNEIVRKVVPVAELPRNLQSEFDPEASVEIIGPREAPPPSIAKVLEGVQRLRASGEIKPITSEEAVRRIRALRDG